MKIINHWKQRTSEQEGIPRHTHRWSNKNMKIQDMLLAKIGVLLKLKVEELYATSY